MSNDYEWLRFVDLDKIATDEEREKLMELYGHQNATWLRWFRIHLLRNVLFYFSIMMDNCKLARFVIDLGAKKVLLDNDSFYNYTNSYEMHIILADMGIKLRPGDWLYKNYVHVFEFEKSRNTARLGAIAAMGAIRSRLRREREREMGGWKDISRIIGRLIWASRKYYSDSSTKRIKK